ncbi:MAG: hypothetical protein HYU39_10670 [Thaumarchaeota archaeon]|nr:hypothetical protein [Nitrososphaerota archaeon]
MSSSQGLVGKKVAVMVRGPKGIITFKGVLLSIEQDFVALQADKGGLLGGKDKKQVTYFSKHGIIGVRLEE